MCVCVLCAVYRVFCKLRVEEGTHNGVEGKEKEKGRSLQCGSGGFLCRSGENGGESARGRIRGSQGVNE